MTPTNPTPERLDDRQALLKALHGARGYLLNAQIDLETGATKKTAIQTIKGGLKMIEEAIAATPESASVTINHNLWRRLMGLRDRLRHPTEEMLSAGDSAIPRAEPDSDGHRMMGREVALAAWTAMVEVLLRSHEVGADGEAGSEHKSRRALTPEGEGK